MAITMTASGPPLATVPSLLLLLLPLSAPARPGAAASPFPARGAFAPPRGARTRPGPPRGWGTSASSSVLPPAASAAAASSSSSSPRLRRPRGPRPIRYPGGDAEFYPEDYGFGDDDTYGYPASDDDELPRPDGSPPSADFAVDPRSPDARAVTLSLGLSDSQHASLAELAVLVVDWNERINLVSRRDCSPEVVFGRHVLPSAALCKLPHFPLGDPSPSADGDPSEGAWGGKSVVDVGTGGGFPGLPLAVCYPQSRFTLVDSVGKKLRAVEAMADELGLRNVAVHHGRAEEMAGDDPRAHGAAYDLVLGRSVAALPRFCSWVTDLLKRGSGGDSDKEEGSLVYIIGGDVEESVTSRVRHDVPLDDLLDFAGASDKRALVLGARDVAEVAAESGEVKQRKGGKGRWKARSNPRRRRREAKGQWTSRRAKEDDGPKQRGYEDFKRYHG